MFFTLDEGNSQFDVFKTRDVLNLSGIIPCKLNANEPVLCDIIGRFSESTDLFKRFGCQDCSRCYNCNSEQSFELVYSQQKRNRRKTVFLSRNHQFLLIGFLNGPALATQPNSTLSCCNAHEFNSGYCLFITSHKSLRREFFSFMLGDQFQFNSPVKRKLPVKRK